MLQAVLICLSGYDSPHIQIIKEKSKYTSLERKKITFVDGACNILAINPSQQQMLEDILILGIHVKELQAFIKYYEYRKSNLNKKVLNGLYVKTLCHGIRELIEEYKHEIILFRRTYGISPISEESISICRLQKTFKKYINLFDCINNNLCQEILQNHLFGGKILAKLLDLVILNGGVLFIKNNLNKLLCKILYIWYNQITSFVAYGILSDSYSEFFINENETYSNQKTQYANQKYELLSWNNQFLINYNMLPIKHIPNHIIDKILFIGKAVRILNAFKYKKETTTNTKINTPANEFKYNDLEIESESYPSSTTNLTFTPNGMNLMLTEQEMFSTSLQLHKLKFNLFNVNELECVLNKIKNEIAHKLWAVLVFHLKLSNHLQTLRNYFLLGNGGFWQCLLDECNDIPALETIPVTVASRDLNFGPFKSAAEKYNIQNELFEKISLKFSLQKFTTRRKSVDLDSIITFESCEKINRKTDVLIRFKMSNNRHGHCWMKLKCPINYGFNNRFNFIASANCSAFAFVIQHDRINWWLQHNNIEDKYGCDICVNSLIIGIANNIKTNKQSCELFVRNENGTNINIETSDIFSNCFDNKQHSLCIIFDYSSSEIKVTVDDELVLFCNQFKISNYIKTEIATGRAWIGITSSLHNNNNNNIEIATIDIIQWSFFGKFMFESYANELNNANDKFWSRLNLEYNISNPMDVIFDSYDLERYNGLFKFLLLLKRAHYNINKCWKEMSINIKKTKYSLNYSPIWSFILSISRRMLFFVNNLQFYIQFEVIDIEYKQLLNKINGTKNIELVMEAHQIFLHSLCRQCFLIGNEKLWAYISKILCLVLQSTQLILNYIQLYSINSNQYKNNYFKQFGEEIKDLQKAFDSSLSQWFELAKNISLNQQSLYKLQRLISQLNYNNWFS